MKTPILNFGVGFFFFPIFIILRAIDYESQPLFLFYYNSTLSNAFLVHAKNNSCKLEK